MTERNKSNLVEIYEAVAAMEMVVDGQNVTGFGPSEALDAVPNAYLPARLLTPISRFSENTGIAGSTWNVSMGSTVNRVDWQVNELFLYEPMNATIGIKAIAGPLLEYCVTFLQTIANGGLVLPVNAVVTNVSFRPDVIEYPLFSGHAFYGVATTILIMEKIP